MGRIASFLPGESWYLPSPGKTLPGQNSRVDDMVFAGARKGSRGWGKGADFMGRIC